jgi:predicted transcriptional regulator of viral defense system
MKTRQEHLIEFIRKKGGFANTSDLINAGFYKALIGEALDSGWIERLSRGVYSLVEIPDIQHLDLVTVSVLIPRGVICLISALSFHEVTDEIPHYIDVAIPTQTRAKEIKNIPVRYYRFSRKTWEIGIEEHDIDGHKIRVYSPAKTIADCFRFRNQIGMDVARSALKNALEQKKVTHREIMKYASIGRVTKIIKPILETLL